MRQNKILVTKNHFLYVAASNENLDELWAGLSEYVPESGYQPQTTNTIGFVLTGSANAFVRDANSNWNSFAAISSPSILMRKNFYNVGIVSTSNSTLFGCIQRREDIMSGQNQFIINPTSTESEKNQIKIPNQSVDVKYKCKARNLRDPITFDRIDAPSMDISIIPDTDIEIEEL